MEWLLAARAGLAEIQVAEEIKYFVQVSSDFFIDIKGNFL
jgi:hypothetical protein